MVDRILVAASAPQGSVSAGAVIELVEAIGAPGVQVEVLHVKEFEYETRVGEPPPEDPSRPAVEFANALVLELQMRGVAASAEVRAGGEDGVAADILAEARTIGAGLIVMGCSSRSGFSSWLFGSVTHHVLRHALCPVLVIHRPVAETLSAALGEVAAYDQDLLSA